MATVFAVIGVGCCSVLLVLLYGAVFGKRTYSVESR